MTIGTFNPTFRAFAVICLLGMLHPSVIQADIKPSGKYQLNALLNPATSEQSQDDSSKQNNDSETGKPVVEEEDCD